MYNMILLLSFLCAGYFLFKFINKKTKFFKKIQEKKNMYDIFKKSTREASPYTIRIQDKNEERRLTGYLINFTEKSLEFRINRKDIPITIRDTKILISFAIERKADVDNSREFYAFRVRVQNVEPRGDYTLLRVFAPREMPCKRTFFRIAPLPNTVSALALWKLKNDEVPEETSEFGPPLLSSRMMCQDSDSEEPYDIDVENISASGIGLRIIQDSEENGSLEVGEKVLTLLVYNNVVDGSDEQYINFCCVGKITNMHRSNDNEDVNILGIEFTKWSILSRENPDIQWQEAKKGSGIAPILLWVSRIKKNRK